MREWQGDRFGPRPIRQTYLAVKRSCTGEGFVVKTLWMEISDLTHDSVQTFRLGATIELVCGDCAITFPQTDVGHSELRRHQFELHEHVMSYDWRELEGQRV